MPSGKAVMPKQTGKLQHKYRPLGKSLGYAKLGKQNKTGSSRIIAM